MEERRDWKKQIWADRVKSGSYVKIETSTGAYESSFDKLISNNLMLTIEMSVDELTSPNLWLPLMNTETRLNPLSLSLSRENPFLSQVATDASAVQLDKIFTRNFYFCFVYVTKFRKKDGN